MLAKILYFFNRTFISWQNFYLFMVKPLPLNKTFFLKTKPLPFSKNFNSFWLNLYFLTKPPSLHGSTTTLEKVLYNSNYTFAFPQNLYFFLPKFLPFNKPLSLFDRVVKTEMMQPFCIRHHINVRPNVSITYVTTNAPKNSLHSCYPHYV
jgi:hypothetical protein